MKKSKVLATTTLAGALLFTGVGATHNAHAADVVNDYNVEDYATKVLGEHYTEAGKVVAQANREEQDYYKVLFAGEQDNGPGEAKVYRDGRVVAVTPNDPTNWKVFAEGNSSNSSQNTNSTNNNTQAATNNETTNNEATNNNTTAATDNTTATTTATTTNNNTQSTQSNEAQTTTQALPETGEQSNSGLITIVASVLLAAGSLLAFRRTSNSK